MNRRQVLRALAVVGLCACDEAKPQRKRGRDDDEERHPRGSQPPVSAAAPPPEPFKFGTELAAGIALASREKRPLIVFFSAEWNVACKQQQKIFATPEFKQAAAGFVGVLVDVTDDEAPTVQKAMLEHKIRGVPAVLVADSTGKEVQRVQSLQPLESWLALLARVK